MNELAQGLWERALDSLRVARHDISISPDAAAARSYYAAFHAVCAHFAIVGRRFRRHSGAEAAVHRDLVKTGAWPAELGEKYTALVELRSLSDYGDLKHVTPAEAKEAIQSASEILRAVRNANPGVFPALAD